MPLIGPGGVLVLDKPKGPTSHDVVARVRRALGTREVGHAGTLDPMATGVLVVAVGEGTKLVAYLTAADKGYEARVVFGVGTNTLDAEGTVTERRGDGPEILARLEEAAAAERARTEQVPPVFSAIKIDGVRAHALARKGEAPELAPRAVAVRSLEILATGACPEPFADVRLAVAKGYYVRAFARDLAASMGTVAHLSALRRIQAGRFTLEGAVAWDAGEDAWRAGVIPLADAARACLPSAQLAAEGLADARCGRAIAAAHVTGAPPEGTFALFTEDRALVALARADGDVVRVARGFRP